ncbi:hypothetical protein F4780DRAFT_403621 [Xylariomycetidae sp. FL0641]|nr:hypothetical protein F4780DRAFT_403621 [Xylariomycetidae sp. FL0641]
MGCGRVERESLGAWEPREACRGGIVARRALPCQEPGRAPSLCQERQFPIEPIASSAHAGVGVRGGPRTRWTVDSGRWTVDGGRWTVDSWNPQDQGSTFRTNTIQDYLLPTCLLCLRYRRTSQNEPIHPKPSVPVLARETKTSQESRRHILGYISLALLLSVQVSLSFFVHYRACTG